MLEADDDGAAQAMAEYLSHRFAGNVPLRQAAEKAELASEFPLNGRYVEDYSRFRAHMRIERNRKLIEAVKQLHGTSCALCGFDFERAYGPLGRGYIEAHHVVPIASRKGVAVELDPRMDFVVLCANCHRMVHRAGLPADLERFKKEHLNEFFGKAREQQR